MITLSEAITRVEAEWETALSPKTVVKMSTYTRRIREMAKIDGVSYPCKELYDLFMEQATATRSNNVYQNHHVLVAWLDRVAGTQATDPKGKLYNDDFQLPSTKSVEEYFKDKVFPLGNNQDPLEYICAYMLEQVKEWMSSKSTVYQFGLGAKDLLEFCSSNGESTYDRFLVEKYVSSLETEYEDHNNWRYKLYRRVALMLMDVAESGTLDWKVYRQKPAWEIPSTFQPMFEIYLSQRKNQNLAKKTIALHRYVFRETIQVLGMTGLEEFFALTESDVSTVIEHFRVKCCENSMTTINPLLRMIFGFLYDNGFVGHCFVYMFLSPNYNRNHLSFHLTNGEESAVRASLPLMSLRNKAIFLLSMDLGLRDSDICNLRFSHIDWKNDRIDIVQKKTGVPLALPLIEEVGNSIMDYVMNERPKGATGDTVFVRAQAPYAPLSTVYTLVSNRLTTLGVADGKPKGTHLLRRTLVYKLLERMVDHQVVTDILGHTAKDTDKYYYSMEPNRMRECSLDFSNVIGLPTFLSEDGEVVDARI